MKIAANIVSERKIGLDLLRAIAILTVIEGHSRSLIEHYIPQIKYLGFTDGVDIFFVLSGFLIGGILIKYINSKNLGIKTFLIRRWYRTLPNFYFAFTINLLIYFILVLPHIDWRILIKTMFFCQNYFPPFSNFSFFPEAWSLSIEEHFYLTFSIILFLANKFWKKNSILIGITIMFLIAFVSRIMILNIFKIDNYNTYNSYIRIITVCRFDSLIIGVLVAFLKNKYDEFYNRKNLMGFLFIMGIVVFIVFNRTWILSRTLNNFDVLLNSTIFSIGIAIMIPFLDNLKIGLKIISSPISYISKISYSMYLFHNSIFLLPIISISQSFSQRYKVYFYIIYWIFVLSVSTIAYNIIEKPFLKYRDKKYPD